MSSTPVLLSTTLLLLTLGIVEGCTNVTSLSQQLDSLLAEYDREATPAQPTLVHLAFEPRHAALTQDSTVHIIADLIMTWSDPRIEWDATDWGCDSLVASADRLWAPDVELLNAAGGVARASPSARVSSSGVISLVTRYDATVAAPVDLTGWPSDRQTAVFKFGSRTYTSDYLELDIGKTTTAVIFETGSWELEHVSGQLVAGGRMAAAWTVSLRRRAAAHEAAAGAVLAAAALLLLAAALQPPPARPPLCAAAAFTAALWLVSALLRLPASSSTPTTIRVFCAVCIAAGTSGVCAALVARVARLTTPPPRPLRALASAVSKLCRLTPPEASLPAEVGAWAALAQLLDYALLAALLLVVFLAVCIYL